MNDEIRSFCSSEYHPCQFGEEGWLERLQLGMMQIHGQFQELYGVYKGKWRTWLGGGR